MSVYVVSIALSCRLSLEVSAIFFPPSHVYYHLRWVVPPYTVDVFLQSEEPARHLSIQLKIHPQYQKRRNTNQYHVSFHKALH